MVWIAFVSLCILGLYAAVILWYLTGLLLLPRRHGSEQAEENVTVVVPFRNEVENLPRLISCLSDQNYPGHLYRVSLVNDHSSDHSLQVARSLTKDDPRFEVLDLPVGKEGKKEAITRAVSMAESRWILQTDADCNMGPDWIHSHMVLAGEGRWQLIAGIVGTERGKDGFLESFERLELLGITGSAAGSFGWGRPLMCSGANLIYEKQLYLDTRKFDPGSHLPSGDDMFLMIGARKLGRASTFNISRGNVVLTRPVKDLKSLWAQRIRWAGKSGWYGMPGIQATAMLVALSAVSVLTAVVAGMGVQEYRWWLIGGILSKCLIDFTLIMVMSRKTGNPGSALWFLPTWVLYQPFVLIVAAGSFFFGAPWKGRSTSPGRFR